MIRFSTLMVALACIALAFAVVCLASGIYLFAAPNGVWTTWFRTADPDPVTNAELSVELAVDYLASFAVMVLIASSLYVVGRFARTIGRRRQLASGS